MESKVVIGLLFVLCLLQGADALRIGWGNDVHRIGSGGDDDTWVKVSSNTVSSGQNFTASWGNVDPSFFKNGGRDSICYEDKKEIKHCYYSSETGVWLGLFSPPEPDTSQPTDPKARDYPRSEPFINTAPIKFYPLYNSEGSLEVEMLNWRADAVLVLFKNGTTFPIEMARSEKITLDDKARPIQGHLSLTGNPAEMKLAWNALKKDKDARVKYGRKEGSYTESAPAAATTYSKSDMCGGPANADGWHEPGWFFEATMSGIKAGETIYYVYGSDAAGWSEERSFKGSKGVGPDEKLRMVCIADMGIGYKDNAQYHWAEPDSPLTVAGMDKVAFSFPDAPSSSPQRREKLAVDSVQEHVRNVEADVIYHIGDLAYATGYLAIWDTFMHMIEPLASRIPYMIGYGNHEEDYPHTASYFDALDSGGECGVATKARFPMPTTTNSSNEEKKTWFSLDQGPVHTIMIDTELPLDKGSEQYAFVEKDLASVDRSVTPWLIFMGHRPMYSIWGRDKGIGLVEDLMYKYKVDLALWGHVHNSQATCPVYKEQCMSPTVPGGYDAPIHAVIGHAGQQLDLFPDHMIANWSVYQKSEFGYSTVEADGAKSLTMNFFADGSDALHHTITITRDNRDNREEE